MGYIRIWRRSTAHGMPRSALASAVVSMALLVSGCSTLYPYVPNAGPLSQDIDNPDHKPLIAVVKVDGEVARRVTDLEQHHSFSEVLGTSDTAKEYYVGPGDGLEVSVWESPPAALFGIAVLDPSSTTVAGRPVTLPEQMVASDGTINIPFGGPVSVSGKSIPQIENDIVRHLTGKANDPQVLVRVLHNATANVTVVGEVGQSVRMPITAKGERLLDAIAAAGGVRQPVGKMTLQISRNGRVVAMPLESVIRDPAQNIRLRPNDVVTALFQTNSFTALGAINRNAEVEFEAKGISLAQAMGRIGGLQDGASDVKGLFIFRFEDPAMLPVGTANYPRTADGKVPMVYRVDFSDPGSFLVAQRFPMHDHDVVYASIAPAVELGKFLGVLNAVEGPVLGVVYATK